MVVKVSHVDGNNTMEIIFPSEEEYRSWQQDVRTIKGKAAVIRQYLDRTANFRFDELSTTERNFVEQWLGSIGEVERKGYGLPPSVKESRSSMRRLMNGEE